MTNKLHFKVYEHILVYNSTDKLSRYFIVLVHEDGTYQFTDFHKYIKSPNTVTKITSSDKSRFHSINKLLNYCFFVAGIEKLDDITVDIVDEYLNLYGMCQLPDDDEFTKRSETTVKKVVSHTIDFLNEYINARKGKCKIKKTDLYKEINYRDRYGKVSKKKVPVFDVRYLDNRKVIFRDIPNKAFYKIYNHIANYHTEILGLVMLSAFGGLRPSEACNVRREDSQLGAGIQFTKVDGIIEKITIDLNKELNLRSDLVSVGNIKKERTAEIPSKFIPSFIDGYNTYMKYMNGHKYDSNYGAFTVNSRGNAMTYASYYQKFNEIIKNEITPLFLEDDDAEIVLYGRTLLENSISPHVFRHWYTVQLVISGIDEPGVLMHYRGDSSPESALTYLKNKGELDRKYETVNNELFEYALWAGQKNERLKGTDKSNN